MSRVLYMEKLHYRLDALWISFYGLCGPIICIISVRSNVVFIEATEHSKHQSPSLSSTTKAVQAAELGLLDGMEFTINRSYGLNPSCNKHFWHLVLF